MLDSRWLYRGIWITCVVCAHEERGMRWDEEVYIASRPLIGEIGRFKTSLEARTAVDLYWCDRL